MLPMLTERKGCSLHAGRRNTAEASGGKSNSVIYSCFKKLLLDLQLKGDLLDFGAGQGVLTETIIAIGSVPLDHRGGSSGPAERNQLDHPGSE